MLIREIIIIMVHGERKLMFVDEPRDYYRRVWKDFEQLKEEYPFSRITLLPTLEAVPVIIKVTAVNHKLVDALSAKQTDFQGAFSRDLVIEVPFDYREKGCNVYGGNWIKLESISEKDWHFFKKLSNGSLQFCVGVPESFVEMNNVILGNVRTAENMLIAYEKLQKGLSKTLELKAFSHGVCGRIEYMKDGKE